MNPREQDAALVAIFTRLSTVQTVDDLLAIVRAGATFMLEQHKADTGDDGDNGG